MAQSQDSGIEEALRQVVIDAKSKEEEVTIKLVRSRVEAQLGLGDGFFKNHEIWKGKSKAAIEAAFEEEEDAEEVSPAAAPKSTTAKSAPVKATPAKSTPVKSILKNKSVETPRSLDQKAKETPTRQQRSMKPPTLPAQPVVSKPTTQESAPALQQSSAASENESGGDSSEESDENEEEERKDGSATKPAPPPVQPASKTPEALPAKVNGVKRKAEEQPVVGPPDFASSGLKHAGEERASKKVKAIPPSGPEKSSSAKDEESSEDEDDESEEGDDDEKEGENEDMDVEVDDAAQVKEAEDEEEEHEESDEEQPDDSESQPAHDTPPQTSIAPIPPKPFKPPPGYAPISSDQLQPNPIFSAENLVGKQIWHITAPSDVPISALTDLALDAIQSGTPILTHKGNDYVLSENQTASKDEVALLAPTKDGYERIESKIDRSLQIHQKITLPDINMRQVGQGTGIIAAADSSRSSGSNVRPQPKGLKMRYKPPGFGRGKPGRVGSGSESEEQDESGDDQPNQKAVFKFPRAFGARDTSIEEVAGAAGTNADAEGSSSKKVKKKRKDKDKAKELSDASQPLENGVSASPEARAIAPVKKVFETSSSALPNGVGPRGSEGADKARRKEEKRLKRERKEAKRRSIGLES